MAVDQGAGDAQAQTVAAQGVARRGLTIGLGELDEWVKDFVLGLDGYAAPTVFDAHHQIALAGAGALVINLHGDVTMVGELERIAQQVDQHLLDQGAGHQGLLKGAGLGQFGDALIEFGIESVEDLTNYRIVNDDLLMSEDIGMTKENVKVLRRALERHFYSDGS